VGFVCIRWRVYEGVGSVCLCVKCSIVQDTKFPKMGKVDSKMTSAISHDDVDMSALLAQAASGDQSAAALLMQSLYDDFRRVAAAQLRREPPGHTLQPTALVHEAFLRLIDQRNVTWQGRTHFIAVGAQAMRRILVDHARAARRVKRGGERRRIQLDESLTVSAKDNDDILAIDDALNDLAALDPRQSKIVELRFFGGMTNEEVATVLGISRATVDRQWRAIKAWLRSQLQSDGES
jgi:RNA polymerase sigma-70 factor, ECF subfamily